MAKITFGLGTSHGPMLSIPLEYWKDRVSFDRQAKHFYRGKAYSFDQMVELRKSAHLADQITPEVMLERHNRNQNAIRQLADYFDQHRPDIAVIVGNDQMEMFKEPLIPAMSIYRGATIPNAYPSEAFLAAKAPGIAIAVQGHVPPQGATYAGLPDLATHLTTSAIADQFDVTSMTALPPVIDLSDAMGAVAGGHCIVAWDYGGLRDTDTVRVATWGQWQRVTWRWLLAALDEAWGLAWAPAPAGVDMAALELALRQVTV